jgi:hypothetical protein
MTGSPLSRLMRWPLWSWRNLSITAVGLLVLLAALGRASNTVGTVASQAPARSAMTATTPVTGPAVPSPSSTTTTNPSATATTDQPTPTKTDAASPVSVATAFVTAWTHGSKAPSAWLAGMKPLATPALLESLTGTDPTQVPATRVSGDAALKATKGSTATVSVPTDGGRILVDLLRQAGAWKASALAPDDAPPGAPTPSLGPASGATTS